MSESFRLHLTANTMTAKVGQSVTFYGTLLFGYNPPYPVPQQPVYLTLGGGQVAEGTTDNSGVATMYWTFTAPGSFAMSARARLAGTTYWINADNVITVTVTEDGEEPPPVSSNIWLYAIVGAITVGVIFLMAKDQ